jgi:hypothetical protein
MSHHGKTNTSTKPLQLVDFIPDKITFIKNTDFLLVHSADYIADREVRDFMHKREQLLRTQHCSSWWTALLRHQILSKFANEIGSNSASWPEACGTGMTLFKFAEPHLDRTDHWGLVDDLATLMCERFFKERRWHDETCPVYYWVVDVWNYLRKGLPLWCATPQGYLNLAAFCRRRRMEVPPRWKSCYQRPRRHRR